MIEVKDGNLMRIADQFNSDPELVINKLCEDIIVQLTYSNRSLDSINTFESLIIYNTHKNDFQFVILSDGGYLANLKSDIKGSSLEIVREKITIQYSVDITDFKSMISIIREKIKLLISEEIIVNAISRANNLIISEKNDYGAVNNFKIPSEFSNISSDDIKDFQVLRANCTDSYSYSVNHKIRNIENLIVTEEFLINVISSSVNVDDLKNLTGNNIVADESLKDTIKYAIKTLESREKFNKSIKNLDFSYESYISLLKLVKFVDISGEFNKLLTEPVEILF